MRDVDDSNLIGGKWTGGNGRMTSINPSEPQDAIGRFAEATNVQVADAVQAARDALPGWSRGQIAERAQLLKRIGASLDANASELGRLLSREEGKPLREGTGEVRRAAELFEYYAGECLRQFGETGSSLRPDVRIEIRRVPVGVVAIVAPWNFPVALPSWKIAPALAYGNTVVFKPSELIPATSLAFARLIVGAGIPAGVFNMVMGAGHEVGRCLVEDEGVDAVSFTGSVATGGKVAASALTHMAKLQMEMGGKNPLVVLDDCDLERAVDYAVQGAFFSAGQRCTASSRLIVQNGIHDRFVRGVTERMAALRIGHALDEASQIGPLVSDAQLTRVADYVEIGTREGALLARGGGRLKLDGGGYYLEPTLLVDTQSRMRINQEEIFGPVASVIAVDDYEEALHVANDTAFGLTAGIVTGSAAHGEHFRQHAEAGVVTVNMPTVGLDFHVPFGGTKRSSYGPREQGTYARDFYTETRVAYIAA